jgi:hypothetical protein
MEEILDQVALPLSIAQSLKNIRFIPLKPNNLPVWTDGNFVSFVRNWLQQSAVEMDRLHKKDYNGSLQSLITKAGTGDAHPESNQEKLFTEFKISVCLYLDFVQ